MKNLVGKEAPYFKLQDQSGADRALDDYKGRVVLLYFYPKDMTPGCTTEAKCFRDRLNEFKDLGVVVLGVSTDSVESHKKFAEKHKLNFPILSDIDQEVVNKYGVWKEKSMFGIKYTGTNRESFLIDRDGKVVKHYKKVKPAEHPEQVLADVKKL